MDKEKMMEVIRRDEEIYKKIREYWRTPHEKSATEMKEWYELTRKEIEEEKTALVGKIIWDPGGFFSKACWIAMQRGAAYVSVYSRISEKPKSYGESFGLATIERFRAFTARPHLDNYPHTDFTRHSYCAIGEEDGYDSRLLLLENHLEYAQRAEYGTIKRVDTYRLEAEEAKRLINKSPTMA